MFRTRDLGWKNWKSMYCTWSHRPKIYTENLKFTYTSHSIVISLYSTYRWFSPVFIILLSLKCYVRRLCQILTSSFFLFNAPRQPSFLASPQQRETITMGPCYLTPLSTFSIGGDQSTRGKRKTSGRVLIILFSHEDRVLVHFKMNLTGDRTLNLEGESQVVWPLHLQSPKV